MGGSNPAAPGCRTHGSGDILAGELPLLSCGQLPACSEHLKVDVTP